MRIGKTWSHAFFMPQLIFAMHNFTDVRVLFVFLETSVDEEKFYFKMEEGTIIKELTKKKKKKKTDTFCPYFCQFFFFLEDIHSIGAIQTFASENIEEPMLTDNTQIKIIFVLLSKILIDI